MAAPLVTPPAAPADDPEPVIYTIGHSNHDADKFLALLAKFNITALVDVSLASFRGGFVCIK